MTQATQATRRVVLPPDVNHLALVGRNDEHLRVLESNYDVRFDPAQPVSQRVIFPSSPSQSNGIEDARFVKFTNTDGSVIYYATYTAYSGRAIKSELIQTSDFLSFRMSRLTGAATLNKGMALFPRKVNGKYVMLCRGDGVNQFISFSDNINIWRKSSLLQSPKSPWEFVQIGNCGSPLYSADAVGAKTYEYFSLAAVASEPAARYHLFGS